MRELIVAREPIRQIKDAARRNGTRFLREAALDLVAQRRDHVAGDQSCHVCGVIGVSLAITPARIVLVRTHGLLRPKVVAKSSVAVPGAGIEDGWQPALDTLAKIMRTDAQWQADRGRSRWCRTTLYAIRSSRGAP